MNRYVIAECPERNIIVAQSGGKENAEGYAKAIYTRLPHITEYITAGLAGAFSVRLDAEDIVVVDTIIDKTNNGWKKIGIAEQIVQSMINQNIQRGPILCSDEYINNPDEKCRLNMKQAPFV